MGADGEDYTPEDAAQEPARRSGQPYWGPVYQPGWDSVLGWITALFLAGCLLYALFGAR